MRRTFIRTVRCCALFLLIVGAILTPHVGAQTHMRLAQTPFAQTQLTDSFSEEQTFSSNDWSEPNNGILDSGYPGDREIRFGHCQSLACRNCCEEQTWLGFVGIEGSKQPQDLGVNAHVGGRIALNHGRLLPMLQDFGSGAGDIGIQIGTSLNATANAVQVLERIEGSTSRLQSFSTIGLFRRSESGITWAAGYDFLYQDYFDSAFLGQWRMEVWRHVFERDEIGLTFALRSRDDQVSFLGTDYELSSLNYGRLNWRRQWESGAYTTFWLGLAESHSEINVALGDLPETGRQLLFGSDLRCPLNSYLSLYGEANFLMPSDTGAVDAFLGIEIATGRCNTPTTSFLSRPVLPLAGSPTFIVNTTRR